MAEVQSEEMTRSELWVGRIGREPLLGERAMVVTFAWSDHDCLDGHWCKVLRLEKYQAFVELEDEGGSRDGKEFEVPRLWLQSEDRIREGIV